jgi:outer membrane murein-binding lipoprotein Lpp
MSITRPTATTPEEAEKIMKEASARGASVLVLDPRVTAWTNWLLGVIGLGLLSGFWSMSASINQLKEQNATLNANVQFLQQQFAELKAMNSQVNAAQDTRLSIYDDRLRAVERSPR